MLGPLVNLILDPILIFGWLGIPAWGIRGAALATVLAQGVSTTWLFWLLHRKHRLLVLRGWTVRACAKSWRRILALGVPAILSMMLMPISTAVITWLLASDGNAAVAAAGAAQRLEMFAFVIPMALGMSLMPFVSQTFGAERWDRVRECVALSTRFAVNYGAVVALVFFASARPLARLFSHDPAVVTVMVTYIRIVSFGYGMMEVHRYAGFVLAGLHRPVASALLNALRVLGVLIPLSVLGARLRGVEGLFGARWLADLLLGCVGLIWVRRVLAKAPNAAHTNLADRSRVSQSAAPRSCEPGSQRDRI